MSPLNPCSSSIEVRSGGELPDRHPVWRVIGTQDRVSAQPGDAVGGSSHASKSLLEPARGGMVGAALGTLVVDRWGQSMQLFPDRLLHPDLGAQNDLFRLLLRLLQLTQV